MASCAAPLTGVGRTTGTSETGMRLSCPTCGARYEVAERLIPIEGRDVQCSRCATTWFQPGLHGIGQPEIPHGAPPPAAAAETAPGPAPRPVPSDAPLEEDGPLDTVLPPRREIDPAILAILRAEAEREAFLRRAEADARAAGADFALAAASDAPGDAPPLAASFLRSGSFGAQSPDIGRPVVAHEPSPEIDHSDTSPRDGGDLSDGAADAGPADPPKDLTRQRRKAARLGFGLALAITAGAVALYGMADPISARAPALAPVLEAYAGALDAARFWLDGMARRLMGAFGAA